MESQKRKKIAFPETALLLLIIVVFIAALTYIVPAGEFDRVIDDATGREIVVAGSYHEIERTPTTLLQLFSSIFRGIVKASDIIAMVFVIGGAFGIVSKTGAITAGLNALIKRLHGKDSIVIALIMGAFALCGATFGMAEEALPFVVIMVTLALKMGYDQVVGVSMVVVGLYCGYSAGPLNVYNTGIAQEIAGLPTFSGIGLRVVLMIGAWAIAVFFTVGHGKKIKKLGVDNSKLLSQFNVEEERELNKIDIIILLILGFTICLLVFCVMNYGWYFEEITALFLAMGLLVGMIYRKGNANQVSRDFVDGAYEMTTAAIFIGLSRAILVVAEDGMIMDTFVYWLSLPLSQLNSVLAAWGIYFSQGIINFLIPSSTGQAVVVMPILTPLSDLINITRQTTVLAFECGDGFWNMITPTHSVLMASCGLAKISFGQWFKFGVKIVLAWTVWVLIILAVASLTNYGPF